MNAKTQLLTLDKQLANWWSGIVGDSKFDRMMMLLKAASFEGNPTQEQMHGVQQFIELMQTITDAEAAPTKFASSGLLHSLELPDRTLKPEPPKVSPTKPAKK